jgi:hypothetical protein
MSARYPSNSLRALSDTTPLQQDPFRRFHSEGGFSIPFD